MNVDNNGKRSDTDLPLVMEILLRSNDVRNTDGLLDLMKSEVAHLLHHEMMLCGYHVLSSDGSYLHNFLQYNYPIRYIDELTAKDGRSESPLARIWRATQEPVLFQSDRDEEKYPAEWVSIFKKYDMRNVIGHGVLDVRGAFGSFFIFAKMPVELGDREKKLLKLITPHLHLALMRVVAADKAFDKPQEGHKVFSARQQEIIRCLSQGKTNKEIAQLLSLTEKNVNYHIEKIFTKLEVRSRAQAISKAILLGILG